MENKETENIDSPNNEPENVDSPNDEPTDDPVEPTGSSDEPEYTDTEKQLYSRAKKSEEEAKTIKSQLKEQGFEWKNGELVKVSQKKVESSQPTDEVTLSRLEVRGVMESEDQEYVLRFAKAEGISPIEALNDSIVKDRLAANERARKAQTATPRSNNRASNQVDEVASWVEKYKKTGELPENNPALTSKILDQLAKGA